MMEIKFIAKQNKSLSQARHKTVNSKSRCNSSWHMSVRAPSQWTLFGRNQRKCNDFTKTQDPSCLSFKSMQQMHKAKTKSRERRVDWLFYLIQFHSLRLEAAHVDGKVVVLLLQQLHPRKHKMPPISTCLREAFSRIPAGFDPSRCLKLMLRPRRLLTDLRRRSFCIFRI